jgi:membrane carboxypeptidase/penicillin-binding protein PbpC
MSKDVEPCAEGLSAKIRSVNPRWLSTGRLRHGSSVPERPGHLLQRVCLGLYRLILLAPSRGLACCARLFLGRERTMLRAGIEKAKAAFQAHIPRELDGMLTEMLATGEDRRFLFHCGFDPAAIARAAFWSLRGRLQGASTIEQQLVRTITGEKQIRTTRKIREILLAASVARDYSKRGSAQAYLGLGYYGTGMEGLDRAIRRAPFPAAEASPAVKRHWAAGMVARLKYPQPSKPSPRWERAWARRTRYILATHARLERAGRFKALRDARTKLFSAKHQ